MLEAKRCNEAEHAAANDLPSSGLVSAAVEVVVAAGLASAVVAAGHSAADQAETVGLG